MWFIIRCMVSLCEKWKRRFTTVLLLFNRITNSSEGWYVRMRLLPADVGNTVASSHPHPHQPLSSHCRKWRMRRRSITKLSRWQPDARACVYRLPVGKPRIGCVRDICVHISCCLFMRFGSNNAHAAMVVVCGQLEVARCGVGKDFKQRPGAVGNFVKTTQTPPNLNELRGEYYGFKEMVKCGEDEGA